MAEQDREPGAAGEEHRQHDGGASVVLGALAERVDLEAVAVDGRLDAGIQQLRGQHQHDDRNQKHLLDDTDRQQNRHGNEHRSDSDLQPERVLVLPGGAQPVDRIAGGIDQAREARACPSARDRRRVRWHGTQAGFG